LYHIVDEVYAKCKAQENFKDTDMANYVTAIYEPFNLKRFPIKIAQMLSSPEIKAEVKIIFRPLKTYISPSEKFGRLVFYR
jgi:amidophosphoribosyltransferase